MLELNLKSQENMSQKGGKAVSIWKRIYSPVSNPCSQFPTTIGADCVWVTSEKPDWLVSTSVPVFRPWGHSQCNEMLTLEAPTRMATAKGRPSALPLLTQHSQTRVAERFYRMTVWLPLPVLLSSHGWTCTSSYIMMPQFVEQVN